MAITYWAGGIIRGTSGDTKPDHAGLSGYNFIETNTGNVWRHDGTAWFKILHGRRDPATGRISQPFYRYTIYKDAFFNFKCYDNYEGAVVSTDSGDASVPIQYAMDNGDPSGNPYGIFISGGAGILGDYEIDNPVVADSGCIVAGEGKSTVRLRPTGNWPVFDLTNKSHVTIRDLGFFQARSDYASTTGMVHIESSSGVLLQNKVVNCNFITTGSGVGHGTCVWIENNTVTGLGNVGPTNNYMIDCYSSGFEWFNRVHCEQDSDWHQGIYIDRCFIDAPVNGVQQTSYNGSSAEFANMVTTNTNAQPQSGLTDNNAIMFDFDNAGTHNYIFHSNNLMWDLTSVISNGMYMSVGTGQVGIQLVNCNDHRFTGSGYAAARAAGHIVRSSQWSKRSGVSVQSGTGSKNWFDIAHGFEIAPTKVWIQSNQNLHNIVSIGSTNITVTMSDFPPSGTDNVTIYWMAEL